MTTFADILGRRLRDRPGQPLLTFYDGATGERTELSVTTYANWVAKVANLLVEEAELSAGDRLRIELPPHWLGAVCCGAAWLAGITVTEGAEAEAVVCGPDELGSVPEAPTVIATALHPLATRFTEPLPAGVLDLGVEVWSQPDVFTALAVDTDLAFDTVTQAELWRESGAPGAGDTAGARLLSAANPSTRSGSAAFARALAQAGSLVLVRRMSQPRLAELAATERATPWPSQLPTRS